MAAVATETTPSVLEVLHRHLVEIPASSPSPVSSRAPNSPPRSSSNYAPVWRQNHHLTPPFSLACLPPFVTGAYCPKTSVYPALHSKTSPWISLHFAPLQLRHSARVL
ncbi:hypothetical protein C8R46DRAFT_1214972 [Mycena filopes]|nr:hypothetical protein C8R46DRAFT_1214972 [Mycena filopes]